MTEKRRDGAWLGFTLDTPADVARARFAEKYGRPPLEAFEAGTVLLVGPIAPREGDGEGVGGRRPVLARVREAQRAISPAQARARLVEAKQLALGITILD